MAFTFADCGYGAGEFGVVIDDQEVGHRVTFFVFWVMGLLWFAVWATGR
jgi:hypothetical protein